MNKSTPRNLARKVLRRAYYGAQRYHHRQGWEIKTHADGMLRPYVYERIYEAVKSAPDGDWLEIGGARGGSTVAIATAMRDSDKRGKLVTVEKFEGGSWETTYGGFPYAANMGWWYRSVWKFGVHDRVTLYPHGVDDETAEEITSLLLPPIAGMMLDADGWVGRDFAHFWPLIRDGGIIIVDDYPTSADHPHEKKARTYHLMNQIIRWGLFEITSRHHDTVIGIKPAGADFSRFDMGELKRIVEQHKRGEHIEW